MIWVLNVNTSSCRIYSYNKSLPKLSFLKSYSHPESRLKNSELVSDKSGHYKAGDSSRGSYQPHMEAKESEIEKFSREIALELNKERNEKEYDKLILIAPPHMMGILLKYMDKHVHDLIINQITKDLVQLTDKELLTYLQLNAAYSD